MARSWRNTTIGKTELEDQEPVENRRLWDLRSLLTLKKACFATKSVMQLKTQKK
jgi:hypothetical protein